MADQSENNNSLRPLNAHLQLVHDSLMQGLGQLADYFGYNRVMGELYATLLLHPGPISLDDLKDRVHKSKASVSMNTRTLELMGAVKEVWVREDNPSNRKYYEAESDFWKILSKILGGREMKDIDLSLAVLEDNIAFLNKNMANFEPDERELAAFYIQRMNLLKDFFRLAKLILTTILEKASAMDVGGIKRVELE
jgi:DNA-binding transcriptional regulator GbsR (MarR family)